MKHYGCACNAVHHLLYSGDMKKLITLAIIAATILLVVNFDAVIIFMLSGFIPGIGVTLPPSTMVAVFVASTLMMPALRRRRAVYQRCLDYYDSATDQLFGLGKKSDKPAVDDKPKLPRRRYQEL